MSKETRKITEFEEECKTHPNGRIRKISFPKDWIGKKVLVKLRE